MRACYGSGCAPVRQQCRLAQGQYCWSRPVAPGVAGLLSRPGSENQVIDQERGSGAGNCGRSGQSLPWPVPAAGTAQGKDDFTVAASLALEDAVPYGIVAAVHGLCWGSKRGASDGRCRAAEGDVRPMKRLVRLHAATVSYRLGSYGMQEVRGSNPRSSTYQLRTINSNGRRLAAFCFARMCGRPLPEAKCERAVHRRCASLLRCVT